MAGDVKYKVDVDGSGALATLDAIGKKLQKITDDFDKVGSKISNMATVTAAALTGLAASAMAFGDQMSDVAAANETTIGSVLGLASAMAAAGGSADNVGRMFQALSNNIDNANSGNIKMAETFGKLGISIQDLGTMSNDNIRNTLIKSIADIKDPAERSARAMEIFGKAAVGVDFKDMAASLDEQTAKYSQYESQIKLAGDAFDSLAKIMKDIKVAATVVFEPLFKYIANLKIDVDTLATAIRLVVTALSAMIAASVIAGIGKLIAAFQTLNAVVSKNKLITLIALLASLGVSVATYTGLMKDADEATDDTNKKTEDTATKVEKVKRTQEGLTDALAKQREAIVSITKAFDNANQKTIEKIRLDAAMIGATDDQKELFTALKKSIEEQGDAIENLNKKKVGASAREIAIVNEQIAEVERLGAATRKQLTDEILNKQERNRLDKEIVSTMEMRNEMENKIKDISDKYRLEGLGGINRELESIRIQEEKILKTKMDQWDIANRGLPEDQRVQLRAQEEARIRKIMEESISKQSEAARIGYEDSRMFSTGWDKAFREYADNATNAAEKARRIFELSTRGMEDAIVNFAKTGKFEWRNFVNSMLEELLRSNIRQLMAQIYTGASGGGGGLLSGVSKLLGFANGGIIPTNAPVLVGERGPELLSNAKGLTVTPNGELGGNYVTYNIQAVDASSFRTLVARDPGFIYAVTEQGRKSLPKGRR